MSKIKIILIGSIMFASFTPTVGFARDITIYQQNSSFVVDNDVVENMVIRVGDVLQFTNNDKVTHNIFSLSKVQKFDLGSISSGKSKKVQFNKEGLLEIECAVHPLMLMVVNVRE